MRADSYNTGIASEYLVLSKLYRLGLESYMSLGNKKSIDIRVVRPDTSSISIDVKSVRGYSSLIVNNVKPLKYHFIVFVIYNNRFDDPNTQPETFIVPSLKIPELQKTYKKEKRIMKSDIRQFENAWNTLLL